MVGRKAETNSTAAITAKVARGTLRPGFFASSDMLEMVSMPVYVTIAMETLAKKLPQLGATPRWTLLMTVRKLSRKINPRMTSANCVTRSAMARTRLIALDSWMPMTFTTIRTPISATVAVTCDTSSVCKRPKRDRYLPNTPR